MLCSSFLFLLSKYVIGYETLPKDNKNTFDIYYDDKKSLKSM